VKKIIKKSDKKNSTKYTDEGYKIYTVEELNLGKGNIELIKVVILICVHSTAIVVFD
jgi:hypothetical protein